MQLNPHGRSIFAVQQVGVEQDPLENCWPHSHQAFIVSVEHHDGLVRSLRLFYEQSSVFNCAEHNGIHRYTFLVN